jgi:replicative DNA helicase
MQTASPYFKTKDLKIPPHNIDAEKSLLGSIIMSPEVMHDVIDIVKEHSFYSNQNRAVWMVLSELHGKNTPIDILSVSSRLKEKGLLEDSGGMAYLTELINIVPSASNAHHYAEIVENKYIMRELLKAGEQINNLGYDEDAELHEILEKAEKALYAVTNKTGSHKYVVLKDILDEAWERLDHLHKTKNELRGVPTGFVELDNRLSGFQKSDLIILAGRPSMGKTALALDMARKAAVNHKVPVAIFSLEMSSQQLVDRMLAAESQVDSWKIRTGHNLSVENDFRAIGDAISRLSEAPIYIDDTPGNNILKIRAVARRLKNDKGIGLIVVDYLQLMVPSQTKFNDNLVQQVTEISRSLKNLARELEVPVLALSQLSRAVEQRGGKPRLSDLRDSGSIEQDADVVMFIHREADQELGGKKQEAEILIEKHRNGPTGSAKLFFDSKKTTFLSMDKGEFKDFNATENS